MKLISFFVRFDLSYYSHRFHNCVCGAFRNRFTRNVRKYQFSPITIASYHWNENETDSLDSPMGLSLMMDIL